MKKILAFILCAVLVCACVPFAVSAAEAGTVVYLDSMASGDGTGSSPENAVATLEDAFAALDLSKDCTIVVSGYFMQMTNFIPVDAYEGKVTITSVYDGVDYRKTNEAAYSTNGNRFFMTGEVVFEYVNIEMMGNFYLIVAQCNPITIGEGVEVLALGNTTGLKFGNALSILGGYQGTGEGGQLIESETKDINITVMSGDYILIGAYNRQAAACNHTGKATITIGGTAHVYKLYTSSVNVNDVSCGDVEITVRGLGACDILYGAVNPNMGCVVNSLTFNWNSGSAGPFFTPIDGSGEGTEEPDLRTTYTNGYTLKYSEHVLNHEYFELVKEAFESSEQVSGITVDVVVTEAPETEAPKTEAPKTEAPATEAPKTEAPKTEAPKTDAPKTDAPATDAPATQAPATQAPSTSTPAEEGPNVAVIIIIAVAVVAVVAVVIVVAKKAKK